MQNKPTGAARTGSPTGQVDLTGQDWQNVMEGVLHSNDQTGHQTLERVISGFNDSGKLPAFKQRIEELNSIIQQYES